ncbi:MAG: hypothetical protein JNL10_18510 [Verrucomicrobiales bacterium]|nr:hypothetical protein [Verrucomicrobiales bacterium]
MKRAGRSLRSGGTTGDFTGGAQNVPAAHEIQNPSAPMSHATNGETPQKSWRTVLRHELTEYLFNFAFLSFFLIAFSWYRRLLLDSYHISNAVYWAPVISSAILAKVLMIGEALRMGRGLRTWPLIIPTIYRTVVFSVLVVVFSVLEHMAGAWIHGKKAADGLAELTSTGWQGLLAWYVLVIIAFLPFFALKEIETVFGTEKVRGLFFRRQGKEAN